MSFQFMCRRVKNARLAQLRGREVTAVQHAVQRAHDRAEVRIALVSLRRFESVVAVVAHLPGSWVAAFRAVAMTLAILFTQAEQITRSVHSCQPTL